MDEMEENSMIINMNYTYRGSKNTYFKLVKKPNGIDIVTEHGQIVETVADGCELLSELECLYGNIYA
jgi:hypothetical protein